MKIEMRPIDSVKPYPGNPRINEAAIPVVAKSIAEFGFCVPILVDADSIIIAGHTRLEAAKVLNLSQVPVVVITDLSPEQIRAYRLADNQTATLSYWDNDKLAIELNTLRELDFDLTKLGFSGGDIEKYLSVNDEAIGQTDADEIPEIPSVATSRPGEIYAVGQHRLLCGDSTKKTDALRLVDRGDVDILVCDPPYAVDYVGKTKDALTIASDDLPPAEFLAFLTAAFQAADVVLKPGAPLYVWHADHTADIFLAACQAAKWEISQRLIWVKDSFILGRRDYHWRHELALFGQKSGASPQWFADSPQTTILEFARPTRNTEHPTMKPVELFKQHLKNSCPPGGAVIDLFGGSGTTLIAAEQLKMRAFLMELLPNYCDVIRERWAEFVHGAGCDWQALTPKIG